VFSKAGFECSGRVSLRFNCCILSPGPCVVDFRIPSRFLIPMVCQLALCSSRNFLLLHLIHHLCSQNTNSSTLPMHALLIATFLFVTGPLHLLLISQSVHRIANTQLESQNWRSCTWVLQNLLVVHEHGTYLAHNQSPTECM
jgi:hypothetical protein